MDQLSSLDLELLFAQTTLIYLRQEKVQFINNQTKEVQKSTKSNKAASII
jgi:hypothetical protein